MGRRTEPFGADRAATDLGANSYALAINNSGEVVGGNGSAFTVINGQLQSLGNPQGIGWSAAYGINDGGTLVGDGQFASGAFRGMVWSPDGSVILLGTLGGNSSQATDIDNSGEVVGFASVSSGYQHAFSMLDGMMIDLGTLGGGSSYAYGINDSGEIVGYSYLANGGQSAFLYDERRDARFEFATVDQFGLGSSRRLWNQRFGADYRRRSL